MRPFILALLVILGLTVTALPRPAPAASLSVDYLTDEEYDRLIRFMLGNSMFILYHEVGHMLISEYDIPVLGREEDAADKLASIVLLDQNDEAADLALSDSADGWYWTDEMSGNVIEDSAFWGEHGLDLQRSYQIVCLMVGSNEEKFKDVADDYGLPADRQERCVGEYADTYNSWLAVLEPHMRAAGDPVSNITVAYLEPESENSKFARDVVKDNELLETVADEVNKTFKLEDGITIEALSCGEENAYWTADDRKATLCYELVDFYYAMIMDQIAKDRAAAQ
jgi:Putative metallopeptidase